MSWVIERLNRAHVRDGFSCGKPALDDFLIRLAGQYDKRNLARTYVLVREGEPKVLGYYSLASSGIPFESVPEALAKRLAKHPIPAILLARLAVDTSVRGQKLGAMLLRSAFSQCVDLSERLGVFALTVDAIDEEAARFYERFGFTRLTDQPDRLLLPIASIRQSGSG